VNAEFLARLTASMGDARPGLNELAVRSYEGVMLWAEAVKLAGTADRNPVIEALRTGITYNGPSGAVTVDPQTHHCIQNVYLAELQDQKFQIIEQHEAQPPADTQLVCNLIETPNQSNFWDRVTAA